MSRWLIIDQGSHATRACLVDPGFRISAVARRPVSLRRSEGGRAEHDPTQLWDTITETLDEVLASARHRPEACAVITQRSTIACWRRHDGSPLGPLLSWQDTRAALPPLDPRQLHRITGLRPSRHYGAAKLRWCLEHRPEVRRAAEDGTLKMGPLAAWLMTRLCPDRPPAVDPCNAARTLLFDLDRGEWSPALLSAFGIERDWLPDPAPTLGAWGELSTVLGPLPVRLLCGDQSVVPFAAGPIERGRAWVQLGTGAFVQTPSDSAPAGLLRSRIGPASEWAMAEATVNGCGAALSAAGAMLGADWERLAKEADEAVGQADLPLYLNGTGGLGSPDWQPAFPSRWLTPEKPEPVIGFATVLESIVFAVRRNLDRLHPLETLVVGGGLARHDGLCQALSDLCRLSVQRPDEGEAGVLGAAALLAGRCEGLAPHARAFEPRPCAALDRRYRAWTRHMPQA